ncbi:MAG TPA: hypothetical protein VHV55_14645 [Pirellulales bacterium]|nr:hypothetical protein [Pirellulales bacterium]
MTRELFHNNSTNTLEYTINSSVTTLTVTSASSFPASGNFRLLVDSEIMLVTGVSSNVFTVVRGYESTTAASHTSGATVSSILTSGSLARWAADLNHQRLTGGPPVGRLLDASGNALTSASFTVTNGVTGATVTDGPDGTLLGFYPAQSSGFQFVTLLRSISAPFSVVTALQFSFQSAADVGFWAGLLLADGSGMSVSHSFFLSDTGGFNLATSKMSSNTSESANYTQNFVWCNAPYLWLKAEDDGSSTLTFSFSHDGYNWNTSFSVSRTDWLSAGPSQCGLFFTTLGSASGGQPNGLVTFASYIEG